MVLLLACLLVGLWCVPAAHALRPAEPASLRPPAVPLVVHDPYFSIWSRADRLTDVSTTHWTGRRHGLCSLVRIDGRTYRLMGDRPTDVPAMEQTALEVTPTRTTYRFRCHECEVSLTFLTPALPDDLDVLSRPLTYLTWGARSADGAPHDVSVLLSVSGELVVNDPSQVVEWSRAPAGPMTALRIGSVEQPILEGAGDDRRIDWGYAYLASPERAVGLALGPEAALLGAFASGQPLPADDARVPRAVSDDLPAMAIALRMGSVGAESVSRTAMLAYDDQFSILYFGRRLRPYWRRNGWQAADLLQAAGRDLPRLRARCDAFDRSLHTDLERVGGPKYAALCALAYRQCLAGCKLAADAGGQPLLFPKENTSNGCIATVDVIYPMAPAFLLLSPILAKAALAPILSYTASPLWRWQYAPHDLGTYPHATRQAYGSEDPAHEGDRMPVEESGNMLLLLAAVARQEGTAAFASRYWPQVTGWARYLEARGFDPENQLCTDDFTGHLAHNANLSVKAILGLAAYGRLCEMRGDSAAGQRYLTMARGMARQWVQAAADGDHTRLAFDRPGTWSQKYNLVWDKVLGLGIFPPEVVPKEIAFYLRTKDRFGLALDNRQPYAKLDWALWTATLADTPQAFRALADPVYDYLDQTPDRHPMADLYWTRTGRETAMHARPVVGGVFIRMLAEPAVWKRWVARSPNDREARWAPLPTPPVEREVVPTAEKTPVVWRYTTADPGAGWMLPAVDVSGWQEGPGGFGAPGTPGAVVRTEWHTPDIWLRREFEMPAGRFGSLQLRVYHDEDVEVYLNGVLAGRAAGFTTSYSLLPIRPAALATLKPGRNLLAVHCHQTTGGQAVDVGIADVEER